MYSSEPYAKKSSESNVPGGSVEHVMQMYGLAPCGIISLYWFGSVLHTSAIGTHSYPSAVYSFGESYQFAPVSFHVGIVHENDCVSAEL